jgi:hypothetical protein
MTTPQLYTAGLEQTVSINGLVHAPKIWARRITRRQEFRKAFVSLLGERDQILSDIGYQRYDILRALRLPLREDAMSYIEHKRLTRPTDENQTRLTR